VNAAIYRIVQEQSGMSETATDEYVGTLKDTHRYHRDVY
jgi:sulfite reductase alpha subunit-like flavoprotein